MGRHAAARVPHDERPARARPWRRGSPDPVPNSAVKPAVAESTAAPGCGRIGSLARAGRFSAPRGRLRAAPSLAPGPTRGLFAFSRDFPVTAFLAFRMCKVFIIFLVLLAYLPFCSYRKERFFWIPTVLTGVIFINVRASWRTCFVIFVSLRES